MDGRYEARLSNYRPGRWEVLRISEENPGSWDRLVITDLEQWQAVAIAEILSGTAAYADRHCRGGEPDSP